MGRNYGLWAGGRVIIDSSAIVAILREETGHEELRKQITGAELPKIGAPTKVETGMVLVSRLGITGKTLLARFLQGAGIITVPFDEEHWSVAIDAFNRFGKGRHPAKLNFGDCLSYAVAALADEPLLCVGDDFPLTDLELVKIS